MLADLTIYTGLVSWGGQAEDNGVGAWGGGGLIIFNRRLITMDIAIKIKKKGNIFR